MLESKNANLFSVEYFRSKDSFCKYPNIILQQLRKNNEAYTTVRFLTNVFVCYAHQGCIYLKNTVNCIITI